MTRRYLTPREWREMFEAQGQKCARCSNKDGPFEADHASLVAFGNDEKPDALLCFGCHKAKTRRDRKAIAKVNRLRGDTKSQWAGTKSNFKWPTRPMRRKTARTRAEIMGC